MERLQEEQAVRNSLDSVTRNDVAQLVHNLAVEIDDAERPRLKGVLQAAVDQVMLDPTSLDCRIHYRIAAGRTPDMASPTGLELYACQLILPWAA